MANIVIDPVIVVMPADDVTRAEVEVWLENFSMWLKEALTAPFTWLHYRKASELLEAQAQFPSFGRLKQCQRKYHLDINITQIARDINAFFRDDTLDLEYHLNSLEYAIEPEPSSIIIKPEQFVSRLPEYIRNSLHILFANCCACKYIGLPFGQQLHIATLALMDGSREITISVVIQEALPDFARPADNKIAQAFPLLITPDDLLPLADSVDLWAKGEHGIIYAIKEQSKRDWPGAVISLFTFRLGLHFIKSVNEQRLDTNDIVLRSIFRAASAVIADRAKDISGYQLHPYRKSETADAHSLFVKVIMLKHGVSCFRNTEQAGVCTIGKFPLSKEA